MKNKRCLPSAWQPGDLVQVVFPENATLKDCKVIKVSFSEYSEPLYDVEVPYIKTNFEDEEGTAFFRIHGVSQWFLSYTQKDWDEMKQEELV